MRCALIRGACGDTARARETSTTPPSAVRSACCALRERHCRRPRLPPRHDTAQAPSRAQGHPGGAHGRRNDPIASPCHGMRCPPVCPLVASWPWLLHAGCPLETMDMTVYERNHERGARRYTTLESKKSVRVQWRWHTTPTIAATTGASSRMQVMAGGGLFA